MNRIFGKKGWDIYEYCSTCRYNNLNSGVVNRGKMLHAAVHNLQSFDRTMDQVRLEKRRKQCVRIVINVLCSFQFSAWLGETESMFENIEQEIERNPLALKVCCSFLSTENLPVLFWATYYPNIPIKRMLNNKLKSGHRRGR